MFLIFAVDENWNIGYEGDVLIKISEDLKRFRRFTIGNIIIMGRKTFDSLPDSKALPDRINIVMTRKEDFNPPDTIVVHSHDELEETLKRINPDGKMEHWCIGGGIIAESLLDMCHKAYITKIYKNFPKADAHLHNLEEDSEWKIDKTYPMESFENIDYQYVDYVRIK